MLAGTAGAALWSQPPTLRIDRARLRRDIEALSVFGRPAGGAFADGVSRIGYSDADIAGRNFVMGLMRQAGLEPRMDAAGNLFARRPGQDNALPPILFGSHIDTVRSGGNFDGVLGSLGAIEVVRTLGDARVATKRPLEIVIWSCEESSFAGHSLNGSRAVVGALEKGELDLVSDGRPKHEAIRRIGGDARGLEEAQFRPGRFHAYVEMHIEQGGKLEQQGIPVGVVQGIVSIDHYSAVVKGMSNHAGTTPMADRKDALLAASELALAVRQIVTAEPGAQVGTVGHMEVWPNASNVIPGEVRMTIELRDLSADKIQRLGAKIEERARAIAAESKTEIVLQHEQHLDGAAASPRIQKMIEATANTLGLASIHLPSGAGHDAQMMARIGEMAMIFVPSVRGISHSPKEYTRWEDCGNGADVLLGTVLRLAAA
jgi:N-carbamoyl-L-amino-acid hydrolase